VPYYGYASLRMTGGDKDNMDKRLKIIIIFLLRIKQCFSAPRESKIYIVILNFSTKNDRRFD
jgi:hypothetical protein